MAVTLMVTASIGYSGEVRQQISRPIVTDHEDAVRAAVANGGEVIRMRWKLSGFLGTLIGLFIPSTGDALISFAPRGENRTEIGFLVTSRQRDGEYFLYGAEIDEVSRSTRAVWSSQWFRRELKQREQAVDAPNIIDYASTIYRLRWDPPDGKTRMTIWSGGRTYPVEIVPLKEGARKIAGTKIRTRGYRVRGVKMKGQRTYHDDIWIYFALDERAIPVEFVGKRGPIKTRIRMIGTEGVIRTPGSSRNP